MQKYLISKFSAKGSNKITNEDAIETIFIDGGLLSILCDGVGADYDPEAASKITISAVKNLFDASGQQDYLERIKETIFDANDFLIKYSRQIKNNNQMTTTLDILYLKDNFAYWGHLGDSRIYYLRGNNLRLLTKDHTLIQKLLEEGFLTLQQASNHPSSNVILKALGRENPEPDLSKMRLNNSDRHRFFLCSDGITSVINDTELQQILINKDFDSIQNSILSLIRSRGAEDDYSFILIEKINNDWQENS